MNKEKIIIIGSKNIDKIGIAKKIIDIDDSFNIVNTFVTDLNLKGKVTDNFEYYMDFEEVQLAFKNNAFMYVTSNEFFAKGVIVEDMYKDDIIVLNFEDFNNISNKIFDEIKPIIIWIDSKDKNYTDYKNDVIESNYCFNKLESMHISALYFRDTENYDDIAKIIINYCYGDPIIREQILEENS